MDSPHTIDDLGVVAEVGAELGRFLESRGVLHALTITRARLYEDTMRGPSLAIREEARAEGRALERLLEAFHEVQQQGIVAREAIRLRSEDAAEDVDEGE
jgi:hypothetical protein